MSFLQLTHLSKAFGSAYAVNDFNLHIQRGEFLSFLGPSGCGKTTTMRMIAGFEKPSTGSVLLNGVDITGMAPTKRKIGMVFQSYALFPHLSAADNIGFGLKIAGMPRAEIAKRVQEMLVLIKLEALGARFPHQLSGGQQQRVALARALAVQPQVLLLDEPLSALDAKIRESVRNEIRDIQQRLGITTVYVTHDQAEALAVSDRVVVMNSGRIEQVGSPQEIYANPATRFVAEFVGTMNFVPATVIDAMGNLNTASGHLGTCAAARAFAPGSHVHLALRPEEVHVLPPAITDGLHATLKSIELMGTHHRWHLQTAALDGLIAEVPAKDARDLVLSPGARLGLGLPLQTARIFAA